MREAPGDTPALQMRNCDAGQLKSWPSLASLGLSQDVNLTPKSVPLAAPPRGSMLTATI